MISTDNHGFDREIMPEYHLYVEARDSDGVGNHIQVGFTFKSFRLNRRQITNIRSALQVSMPPNTLPPKGAGMLREDAQSNKILTRKTETDSNHPFR